MSESYRYERKFLVPAESGAEPGIRLNPGLFSGIYHPRTVNNIYLDSAGMGFYFRSIEGAAERVKVRVRWYGELFGEARQPVLEFKLKRGLLGRKESYPLQPLQVDQNFSGAFLKRAFHDSELPDHARQLLRGLEPTLINRYRRSYYQSADRKFRLTLDSALEFRRARPGSNSFLSPAARSSFRVLELKYDQAHGDGAREITDALPFRLAKMSKYTYGVDCLDGY